MLGIDFFGSGLMDGVGMTLFLLGMKGINVVVLLLSLLLKLL
jgi:hypothetical protein